MFVVTTAIAPIYFDSLDEALKFVHRYYQLTGNILGIEEDRDNG